MGSTPGNSPGTSSRRLARTSAPGLSLRLAGVPRCRTGDLVSGGRLHVGYRYHPASPSSGWGGCRPLHTRLLTGNMAAVLGRKEPRWRRRRRGSFVCGPRSYRQSFAEHNHHSHSVSPRAGCGGRVKTPSQARKAAKSILRPGAQRTRVLARDERHAKGCESRGLPRGGEKRCNKPNRRTTTTSTPSGCYGTRTARWLRLPWLTRTRIGVVVSGLSLRPLKSGFG